MPTQEGGANLLFGQISPKLHENEENWTEGKGGRLKCYYVDLPLFEEHFFCAVVNQNTTVVAYKYTTSKNKGKTCIENEDFFLLAYWVICGWYTLPCCFRGQ